MKWGEVAAQRPERGWRRHMRLPYFTPGQSGQRPLDLRDQGIERRANAPAIRLLDEQRLQFGRPNADFRKAERPRRTGERMGEADQSVVGAGQGLTHGLQFAKLIGAAGEETLAQRGEGIG